jgi:hypothetical protein
VSGCKKYGEWLTDAALGTLAPRRERKLLAHACECDACREAYRHAREVAQLVDRSVESFVSGQPSPDFEVRLRARIAERPRRSTPWTWKSVASAAVVVAVIALILVARERHRPHSNDLAINTDSRAGLDLRTKVSQPRRSTGDQRVVGTAPLRALGFHPRPSSHHLSAPSQPEVLVEPGQLTAIIQFAKAVNSGQIDGRALPAAQQRVDAPLEIEPLKIGPLELSESDATSRTREDSSRR